jgi:5'-nucleotidase
MPLDLSEILVIGVSSRSLFNLEQENKVFEGQGIKGFSKFQAEKEDGILAPGTAFYLVKSLLELNNQANKKIVQVVVISKNSPETGVRVLKSIKHLGVHLFSKVAAQLHLFVNYASNTK